MSHCAKRVEYLLGHSIIMCYFRVPVAKMRWFNPGANLYIKTIPKRAPVTISQSSHQPEENARKIAHNSFKINLGFHEIRGLSKDQLWDRILQKLSRSIFNQQQDHLNRDMLPRASLIKFIQTRNKQLANESMQICITERNAYRPG